MPPGRSCDRWVFHGRHGRAALGACAGLTRAAESGVHPVCPPGGPRDSRDEGGRDGGWLLAELAVRESVTLAAGWLSRNVIDSTGPAVPSPRGTPIRNPYAWIGISESRCTERRIMWVTGDHLRPCGRLMTDRGVRDAVPLVLGLALTITSRSAR